MAQGCMATSVTFGRRHAWNPYCRMRALALLGMLAFSAPAAAESRPGNLAYTLAVGDRVAVTVIGQPELSSDMLVDDAGNVVVPFIGPVTVENLTVAESQELIRRRLADGFLNQPVVSVRVSEPRPLYVLGDVRVPGAYPFRYGSTVKSAVALAGGFGYNEPLQTVAASEFLQADERVRQLTFQRQVLLVRQARLEAQRDGKDTFSLPGSPRSAESSATAPLVAFEKAAFDSQSAILQAQLELLRSQKPRLISEIIAINSEIAAERKRLDLVKKELEQSGTLLKQGLGLRNTEVRLELEEASQESNLWRLAAQVSRLQMDSGELDIKTQEAEAAFKRQVSAELRDVRERAAELDVTLPSAREIREVKLQQAGNAARVEVARPISITRMQHGQAAVFQATETVPLEPGDIVDVGRSLSSDGLSRRQILAE